MHNLDFINSNYLVLYNNYYTNLIIDNYISNFAEVVIYPK